MKFPQRPLLRRPLYWAHGKLVERMFDGRDMGQRHRIALAAVRFALDWTDWRNWEPKFLYERRYMKHMREALERARAIKKGQP